LVATPDADSRLDIAAMSLRILCSGHLVRYPLGGHSWHHLQYLIGLHRLGQEVFFFEDFGWPDSCYDPASNIMTSDPAYGVAYTKRLLEGYGLGDRWCYLAEDGTAHGFSREELAEICRTCDLYLNLSNINWIPELELCRRRALVDTDPVFTQLRAHGLGGPFERYHALFSYGENVHRPGCDMPTGGARWKPTRQPVVLDLWEAVPGDPAAPFTTVVNWRSIKEVESNGRIYGQKDREFEPFFSLPRETGQPMEIAASAPGEVKRRLAEGGWALADPREVTRNPSTYQAYIRRSRAEFCVAKHAYVTTRNGWFSDRSSAYLASGRPAIIQDTGFSDFLPCGEGLLAWRKPVEAVAAVERLQVEYQAHCRAARSLAESYFDARVVLSSLLENSW
jgi:hypothetical protein